MYTLSVNLSLFDFRKPVFNPIARVSSRSMKLVWEESPYRIIWGEALNSASLTNVYHLSPRKFG